MYKSDEVKFVEEKIKKLISSTSREFYQMTMRSPYPDEDDESGWTDAWIKSNLIDLYYCICAYIELHEMPNLLLTFQELYKDKIIRSLDLLDSELTHPDGEFELKLITGYNRFLNTFKNFDHATEQEEEFSKLLGVLRNTGFIIRNTQSTIVGEADIYKQVRWILGLYYPSCRTKGKAAFIKQFKNYNPDILIPELKTAIEYKYLKKKSKTVDEFIDEIKIDSVGYTGDYNYENFVAVFYISDAGLATPESIRLAWKAKDIPHNWTLIITGEHISPDKVK